MSKFSTLAAEAADEAKLQSPIFWIKLESTASSTSPVVAAAHVAMIATRLGVSCAAEINGIEVHAHPGDDPERLAGFAMHQWETGGKIAMDFGAEAYKDIKEIWK